MIVVKIDLAQHAVTPGANTHPVIHSNPLQPLQRRGPFDAQAVPGVSGNRVVIENVCRRARAETVGSERDGRTRVGAAGMGPARKSMGGVEDGLADFGISEIATGLGSIERFLPAAYLARGGIKARNAIEKNVSADDRHDQNGADHAEQHIGSLSGWMM